MKILNIIFKIFSYIIMFMSMVIIVNKLLSLSPFDKLVDYLLSDLFKVFIYLESKSLELTTGISLINN